MPENGGWASLTPGDLQPPSPPPPRSAQPNPSNLPSAGQSGMICPEQPTFAGGFQEMLSTGQQSALPLARGFGSQAMLHLWWEGASGDLPQLQCATVTFLLRWRASGGFWVILSPKGGSSPSARFTPTEAARAGSCHRASAWILLLPGSTLFPAPEVEILEVRGIGSRIPWPLRLPQWESPGPGLPY